MSLHPRERFGFEALIGQLDEALASLGEPPVHENEKFQVSHDPASSALPVVKVVQKFLAPFAFTAQVEWGVEDGEGWAVVTAAGFPEFLELPLWRPPGRESHRFDRLWCDILPRLLTSSLEVNRRFGFEEVSLTDAMGQRWCRNKYFGWNARSKEPKRLSYPSVCASPIS